jgi:hypothetical protein
MNAQALLSVFNYWSTTQSSRFTAELLPGPPAMFELPGHASSTSRGVLLGVYPDPNNQEICLGVWVPEKGYGLWLMVTGSDSEEFNLNSLPSCATPEDVVAAVDRLAQEFITILEKDRA